MKSGRPIALVASAFTAALFGSALASRATHAAESGFSNFLQGGYGDFGVAVAPAPGLYLRNDFVFFTGSGQATTADGLVTFEADARAVLNYVSATYVSASGLFGAVFAAGLFAPINYVDADVTARSALGVVDRSSTVSGPGDIVVVPASFYWSRGNLHLNVYEAITVPKAPYDATRTANTGRNQWSFDTVAALTFLDTERGIEVSVTTGFVLNTENTATNYRTGTEVHSHVMVNKSVTENVALGLHAYVYRQVTDDSGEGALFGAFRSSSAGLGPALLWRPAPRYENVYLMAKWLHDVQAENRLKGEQVVVRLVSKF